MGIYLNPGNHSFQEITNDTYVDKTGLVDFVNGTIDTPRKLTCFSRPRRFGKTFDAMMLSAYYDKGCDSRNLFEGLAISQMPSFEKYLNKLDVIYLDITMFTSIAPDIKTIIPYIQQRVISELREAFPSCIPDDETALAYAMLAVTQKYGSQFFIIIDEWDAIFREAKDDDAVQKQYIQLLRGLFKSGPATKAMIAGAYMTGILPIKKYGTQSAMTDFREYSMAAPLGLAEYVGFTEPEVASLCDKYGMDFDEVKQWYDGYSFANIHSVYSSYSVMQAVTNKVCKSYWTRSETYQSLHDYISMNFDGLKDAIIAMLGGERVTIYTNRFQNDMKSLQSMDDVLTLLVHLGYLAFDEESEKAYIPNLEIADEFKIAIEGEDWKELEQSLRESEHLLAATIDGDADAVAEALELAHESCTSIIKYNDENALSCTISIAYYTARRKYKIFRELPAGKGFADIAFIPRKNVDGPALLVELKCDASADSAIRQIEERRYDGALRGWAKDILLVGISYDKATKKHSCVITSSRIG